MEFLRFGSSIPGAYWGCCAVCIIQNFKVDPDKKASIQLVDGDGGYPLTNNDGFMFAGPTYRDIFWQRLRYGTFGSHDMPNHGFIAILTQSQISGTIGRKWLALLKEAGFEFLRTVDNSVYSGASTITKPGQGCTSAHPNYVFGLFRNIGSGAIKDPYTPPKEWTDLPTVVPESWRILTDTVDGVQLNQEVQEKQLELYKTLPKSKFLSEKEVTEAGAPVVYAGQRSKFPQQEKSLREKTVEALEKKMGKEQAAPFLAVSYPDDPDDDFDDEDGDYCGDGCDECCPC